MTLNVWHPQLGIRVQHYACINMHDMSKFETFHTVFSQMNEANSFQNLPYNECDKISTASFSMCQKMSQCD